MYSRRPSHTTSHSPSHSANGAHTTPTPHSAPKRRAPSSATSSTTSTTTSPTSTSKTSLLYGNAHTFLPLSHSERRPVGVPNPSCAYMRTGCTPACHANPPQRNSTGSHWYSSARRDASPAFTQASMQQSKAPARRLKPTKMATNCPPLRGGGEYKGGEVFHSFLATLPNL